MKYCFDFLEDSFDYFESHFGEEKGILKEEIMFFKFCKILDSGNSSNCITNEGFDLKNFKELKIWKLWNIDFDSLTKEFEKYLNLSKKMLKY